VGRTAIRDVDLGGVTIPAGASVLTLFGSGNRDETLFDEPDAFLIDRPDVAKRHIAFGYGPHMCLGAPLARLEGQLAFESLLARLDNIRLDEEKSDLSHTTSTKFRAPLKVHITFDRSTRSGTAGSR
jgi:cytochrome P450